MLMPKRTKFRRVQRGRMKGAASRGNKVAYGERRYNNDRREGGNR